MNSVNAEKLKKILDRFPLPDDYVVLDVLTAGFQAHKHMVLAYAASDSPTQRLGWLREDYVHMSNLPATVDLQALPEKVENQQDAYQLQGNVYGMPDGFLYDTELSVSPKQAAAQLYDIFKESVDSLNTENPMAIVSHNISAFITPFLVNLLNWHGYDGNVVHAAWQYDTAVLRRAVDGDITPLPEESWREFCARVIEAKAPAKWNLAACRQDYSLVMNYEADIVQNNIAIVEQLLQHYRQCVKNLQPQTA